ncbi:precorrin-3B synthase [Nonomuraea sp. NPDC050643]|uniref:precorrin-3B synthase n=1 Tax=Nonomuraea sp. NPDC050643 TaxID=3155660 RepID=UPI0033D5D7D9
MSIADFPGRVRPDACPGALQVHQAADGPLARVRLPGGAISPARLLELAACAAELGTGVIELTSRANVQVRGLRSPAAFAARIAAAGLLPSPSHERVRNIVASPLGGRAIMALVEALDHELCARPRLAGLPGRFLFALDDGTGDMTALNADVTHLNGRLLLAGADSGLALTPESVVPTMLASAEAFLDERAAQSAEPTNARPPGLATAGDQPGDQEKGQSGGPAPAAAWRIGELPDGPARIAARLGGATTTGSPLSPAVPHRPGCTAQRDGRVALEVLAPLGRLTPAQARTLAAAGPVRLTPWRSVVVPDLPADQVDDVARRLEEAGLSADPRSPWAGVTACTGRPGCAKSLADVQADARRWVASLTGPRPTPTHWAGCERRCGLPPGEVTQMVATGDGYQERQQ